MPKPAERPLSNILLNVAAPILVMLMVGSLVLFVIDVGYRGPHYGRLCWIFSLFAIASVLVARISILEGQSRANLFAVALGIATFVTTMILTDFSGMPFLQPFLVLGVVLLVMWSASQLTWDTTIMDRSRDVSAMGLADRLRQATLRDSGQTPSTVRSANFFSFWKSPKSQNTPGLWVLYFSMAALPIFGFGQWFVPNTQPTYWIGALFAIYIGSGMTLLAVTSLLGLQHYLNQRQLELPADVSRNWLVWSVAAALAIMLLLMVLPKWNMQSSFSDVLARFVSRDRGSSLLAVGEDGTKENADAANQKMDPNGNQQLTEGTGEKGSGGKGKPGDPGNSKDHSQAQKGNSSNPPPESEDKSNLDKNNNDQNNSSNDKSDREDDGNDKNKTAPSETLNDNPSENNQSNPKRPGDTKNLESKTTNAQGAQQPPPTPNQSPRLRPSVNYESLIKALVYAITFVALAIVSFLFRHELLKLWQEIVAWFTKRKVVSSLEASQSVDSVTQSAINRKFSEYRNPFLSNDSKEQTQDQLVVYTFAALEALGNDASISRGSDETPKEFAHRLGRRLRQLKQDAAALVDLYCQTIYSQPGLNNQALEQLRAVWNAMESTSQSIMKSKSR